MIEGLKVIVKTGELKTLCDQQAMWHEQRASQYREQLAGIQEVFGDPGEAGKYVSNSNADPRDGLKTKIVQHINSARELKFIAEHLSPNDSYLLDHLALSKLGIVRSSGFF